MLRRMITVVTSMWILVATWQGDSDCWNETEIQLTRDTEGAVGCQLYGSGNNHFVSRNGNSR